MERKIKPGTLNAIKEIDRQFIIPCLWFDNNAEEAVKFYTSVFRNTAIKTTTLNNELSSEFTGHPRGSVLDILFRIEGLDVLAINGGPVFQQSPAISFMVNCRTMEKINELWASLSEGGQVLMEIGHYDFSERYGWVQDKYGISWQLIMSPEKFNIAPCLMFSRDHRGKAEEAINFYMSVFSNSSVERIERYKEGDFGGPVGAVAYSSFNLGCQNFKAMDSGMDVPFQFNPSFSLVINCNNQREIDHYWDTLSQGGNPEAQQCGWLADRYNLSWQVVPAPLGIWTSDTESEAAKNVMRAMYSMKKLDFNALKYAYDGGMTNDESEIDFQEQGAHTFEQVEKSQSRNDSLAPNEEL